MFKQFWEPKLLRVAIFVAVALFCLILVVVGAVLPQVFRQKTIEVGENYATQITRNLNEIMFREFIPQHPEAAFGENYQEERWQTDMDRFVQSHISGLQIVKVKLFNREGRMVYSTDRSLIGLKGPPNAKLESALSGKVASAFESKKEVWDIPGEEGPDQDLIETYLPIFELVPFWGEAVPLYEQKQVIGAFEIYQEVETLYGAITSLRHLLHYLAFGLLSLLVIAFLALAFKGDRIIRTKDEALEAAELRESRQRHWTEDILSSMDEGVVAIDEDYRIVYLNGVAAKWFGETLGKKCYRIWAGQDIPCTGCTNQSLLEGKVESSVSSNRYHNKILDTAATLTEGPDGSRTVLRVMRDVTERVNRKRQIQEMKRTARKKLFEERVNTVRQMAVALKHRLNNFLTGLMGVLSVLYSEEPGLSEEARHIIQRCQKEAESVRELIEKLPEITDPVVADYIKGIQMIDLERSIGKESSTTNETEL